MFDREAELGISDAGARTGFSGLDHHQPPIDLAPPVHPRGVFLADEAALGEADAVQFGRIAFEPEDVAKLGAAFGDPEAEAVLEPALGRLRRRAEPAAAERGQARVVAPCPSGDQWTARLSSRSIAIGRRRR